MKNKILTVLSIIILIVTTLSITSLATITSASASLKASKESYNLDDEEDIVSVTLRLDSLKSNNGVIAYSAVLEYDKDKLSYLDCSGSGKWAAPSFSEENGQLIADRSDNDFSEDGEDLCTIRFKTKSAGENIVIKFKDIELSSGELGGKGRKAIGDAEVSINITTSKVDDDKDDDDNKDDDNKDDNDKDNNDKDNNNNTANNDQNNNTTNTDKNNTNKDNTNKNNSNTNKNNANTNKTNTNSTKKPSNNNNGVLNITPNNADSKIPNAGINPYLTTLITILVVISIILFVRIKLLDQRIGKEIKEIPDEKKDNK